MNQLERKIFISLYGNSNQIIKKLIERHVLKKERGQYWSVTLREIYQKYYGLKIGIGTYGCFKPIAFPKGCTFGNYCSIADEVRYLNGNHPMDFVSTHPMFYNKRLGYVKEEQIVRNRLTVGYDVWIGFGSKIVARCQKNGNGAVIAVTKDVKPYTIVAGVPARPIGKRFSEELMARLEATKWYELPPEKLVAFQNVIKNPEEFLKKFNQIIKEE